MNDLLLNDDVSHRQRTEIETLFPGWTQRTDVSQRRIDPLAVEALAATLDLTIGPADNKPLRPGWHWMFFNPVERRSSLGNDGHPVRDALSFLPPVPLPRRMWAGSRTRYIANLPIGTEATRTSRILRIENKEGRAGHLCFLTVEHRIAIEAKGGTIDCIVEEQDIVYREAPSPTPQPASVAMLARSEEKENVPDTSVASAQWRERVIPDSTMLFRYSALTFNGHRIHYDQPYARDVEGYRNLVVHGPLTATLLQNFAQTCKPQCGLKVFEFRGVSPLFVDDALELHAWCDPNDGDVLQMRAVNHEGVLAMHATARMELL